MPVPKRLPTDGRDGGWNCRDFRGAATESVVSDDRELADSQARAAIRDHLQGAVRSRRLHAASLSRYKAPDPCRPELYQEAERLIGDFKDEYWIVGVTVTTIFETAWALRGYEQLLMDFVEDPDLAECILEMPYRYHLTAAEKLVRMGVDMIWIGDDVGAQNAMLISPFGTPEDVRAEVLTRLRTLGADGGLILGPTHHVQLDTPMENFWAMLDTITGTASRVDNPGG